MLKPTPTNFIAGPLVVIILNSLTIVIIALFLFGLWKIRCYFILAGQIFHYLLTGLLHRSLAYGNSRFCFLKFTKPVHEHHLSSFASASQTCFCVPWQFPALKNY
jgi:hypothetical protein